MPRTHQPSPRAHNPVSAPYSLPWWWWAIDCCIGKGAIWGDIHATDEETEEVIIDAQALEHWWRNDHVHKRVFATLCTCYVEVTIDNNISPCFQCLQLLCLNLFKRTMKNPVLVIKNYIFVNHCFRDPVLGDLYVKVTGVKELLNAAQVCFN